MGQSEVRVLFDLIRTRRCSKLFEAGMANGSGSIALLAVPRENSDRSLASVRPYQFAPVGSVGNVKNDGYSGEDRERRADGPAARICTT